MIDKVFSTLNNNLTNKTDYLNYLNIHPLKHIGVINNLDNLDGLLDTPKNLVYTAISGNYLIIGYNREFGGGYGAQLELGYFGAIRHRTQQAGVWQAWKTITAT